MASPGCSGFIVDDGSYGHEVDFDKIGSGSPVVAPANNGSYWNGEKLNYRD